MSLCLRGKTIIIMDPPIRPSIVAPGALLTPEHCTLPGMKPGCATPPPHPPWSLCGAAGFDSSYRASIQPEIKPWWENTGLDGQTGMQIHGAQVNSWTHAAQVEGTRSQGKAKMNGGRKCLIFLWEAGNTHLWLSQTCVRPTDPCFEGKTLNSDLKQSCG